MIVWLLASMARAEPPCTDSDACAALAAQLALDCERGDIGKCVLVALWNAEQDGKIEETIAQMRVWCAKGYDDACIQSSLLSGGAPPRAWPAEDAGEEVLSLSEIWKRCYWPRVLRGSDPFGALRLVVQYGPDGQLEGAVAEARYLDEALSRCLVDEAARATPQVPREGLRIRYAFPLDHGARVWIAERGESGYTELSGLPAQRTIEECVPLFEPRQIRALFRPRARPEVLDSSGSAVADACVVSALAPLAREREGWLQIIVDTHVPVRPQARPLPPLERPMLPVTPPPPLRYARLDRLPSDAPDGRCTANLTIGEDGYPQRVAIEGCPEPLHTPLRTALADWQWVSDTERQIVLWVDVEARGLQVRSEQGVILYMPAQ